MKTEPTVGNFLVAAGKFVGVVKNPVNHEALVDDALDAFTKAEKKMENAIIQIDAQIAEEQLAIVEAQKRVDAAGNSKDKLSRVIDRIKALTA